MSDSVTKVQSANTPLPKALLAVNDLHVSFDTEDGPVEVLKGVSFEIGPKRILGVVGESGCGKSVTARSIMRILDRSALIRSGSIEFQGRGGTLDLAAMKASDKRLRAVRGNEIGMIFQEPMSSLNPVLTVGHQIAEGLRLHRKISKDAARVEAVRMLRAVGIPSPEERFQSYPHQLSGGMRQRVMIAMALCCDPSLLIADEPTTALDVTIQAQILDLLNDLRDQFGTAILFITHDLGVVANTADDVMVMYLGRVIEHASTEELFANPQHPYTRGLIGSVPAVTGEVANRLVAIDGSVPSLARPPSGCGFRDRCPYAFDRCAKEVPQLDETANGHRTACHLFSENEGGGDA